jgi:hypothetical protein
MSSTEQYPEVPVDESGIVPQQANRPPDWPKKIRTLTATELDRLTIDSAGRFYWDGRLVNYEPPESAKPKAPEQIERAPVEAEPAAYSHDEPKPQEIADSTDLDRSAELQSQAVVHRDERIHDLDDVRAAQHRVIHHHDTIDGEIAGAIAAPVIQMPDRFRIKLSRWQSLGAILAVLCLMFGALGVGAFGLATAHDWGCRTGMVKFQCPAPPPARTPARSDIPA